MISDNVLLAQEIFHSVGNESRYGGLLGMKLEMECAYDLMRWDFLEVVLI